MVYIPLRHAPHTYRLTPLLLSGLFGSDSSELVDLVVDDSRRLLYSLSASSVIQVSVHSYVYIYMCVCVRV